MVFQMIFSDDHITFSFVNYFYFKLCMRMSVCKCVHMSAGDHRDLQRVLDLLELELLMVMILQVGD